MAKPKDIQESAAVWVPIADLSPWASNPRQNASAIAEVAKSIRRFGWGAPIVANKRSGEIIAGHTRFQAAQRLGLDVVPVRWLDLDPADAHALALADNKLGEIATWDDAALADVLREIQAADESLLADTGFSEEELAALLGETSDGGAGGNPQPSTTGNLSEKFLIPPFTVLNAREGWWQSRKREWLALGIQSELGRGGG